MSYLVNEVDQFNKLRLVDGVNEVQGRIEIEYYDTSGTICDDYFTIYSANVACRRLGYVAASRVITNVARGSDPIWMDNVQCIGNESSLEMCPHSGFGNVGGCSHAEDVGVECISKKLCMYDYDYCDVDLLLHTYIATCHSCTNCKMSTNVFYTQLIHT